MKSILLTVPFMLFSLSITSASAPFAKEDCRETVIYDNFDLSYTTKIEKDLLSGFWVFGNLEKRASVYRFMDDGLLEIIKSDASGEPRYESYLWRIEEYNNQAFLVLTTNDFKREILYQTLPTCQGMVLLDPVSINQIDLQYNREITSPQLQNIAKKLSGSWDNASYPYDLTNNFEDCGTFEPIEGAYLQYQFNPDGTFTKNYGSHHMQIQESGHYEVFGQGQFIVFHTRQENGNYTQHVARLKYLDYGELVLEQSLESDDFAQFFCSELKSITFVQ